MFPGAVVGPCYQSSSASQVRPGFGGVVRPAGAGMTGPGRQTFSEGPSRVSNGSGRFCRAQNINSNEVGKCYKDILCYSFFSLFSKTKNNLVYWGKSWFPNGIFSIVIFGDIKLY